MDNTGFDELTLYCRKLGGKVPFKYCRTVSDSLPCSLVLVCWEASFDIFSFINENYQPEEIEHFLLKKTGRMERILSTLDEVQKDQEDDDEE